MRVNLMAYSLLHLFRRPLPEVLRERIMDRIGASAIGASQSSINTLNFIGEAFVVFLKFLILLNYMIIFL